MLSVLNYMRRRKGKYSNNITYSTINNDESPSIVQKYWPCFAIISCAIMFTFVFYATFHFNESNIYPHCSIPQTFLKDNLNDYFLTYLYQTDTSNDKLLYTPELNVCSIILSYSIQPRNTPD